MLYFTLFWPLLMLKQNGEICKDACSATLLQAGNIGHQIAPIFQIKLLLFNIGILLPDTCFSKH